MDPCNLLSSGFTGVAILLNKISNLFGFNFSTSLGILALNIPAALLAYKSVSHRFTLLSCIQFILTSVFLQFLDFSPLFDDLTLNVLFGGFLYGMSVVLALRANGSTGGTDFIAMWISQRTNQPAWNYILAMNAVMLVAAGYLFGWNAALYSIIFQFCSTQVINFVHTRYKRMTLFIVTSNPDIVIEEIQNSTHHGVTRLEGIGTYYGRPRTMLYTVVDSQNVKGLVTRIREIDQTSFVNVTKTESVEGKFYQRPIE